MDQSDSFFMTLSDEEDDNKLEAESSEEEEEEHFSYDSDSDSSENEAKTKDHSDEMSEDEEEKKSESEKENESAESSFSEESEESDEYESEEEEEKEKQRIKDEFFSKVPEELEIKKSLKSFDEFKLHPNIMRAIKKLSWKKPTPIQSKAIPVSLMGRDIVGAAATGSGKTGAFLLPVLDRLMYRDIKYSAIRVIILMPTRELAAQCFDVCEQLTEFTDVICSLVVGGFTPSIQAANLQKKPDIVIGTPGRLLDHILNSKSVGFEDVEILILDEADRLLDMGFREEVDQIVNSCPAERQSMLFSATMTDEVEDLISLSLKEPIRLFVDGVKTTAKTLNQEFVRIRKNREFDREPILLVLCSKVVHKHAIIFFKTKWLTHRMKILFNLAGLSAAELHGNLTQIQRLESLEQFRDGDVNYLLCTDVAARGLDIPGVQTVINFNMPQDQTQYIHRVGRTARAQREGRSISLVGENERKILKEVIKFAEKKPKNRSVDPELIEKMKTKIENLQPKLQEILNLEQEEKMLRVTEMEANRAENLVKFHEDIMARPRKQWFQTERQKKEVQERYKQSIEKKQNEGNKRKAEDITPDESTKPKRDKFSGLTRKKKRRKLMAEFLEKEKNSTIEKQIIEQKKAKKVILKDPEFQNNKNKEKLKKKKEKIKKKEEKNEKNEKNDSKKLGKKDNENNDTNSSGGNKKEVISAFDMDLNNRTRKMLKKKEKFKENSKSSNSSEDTPFVERPKYIQKKKGKSAFKSKRK